MTVYSEPSACFEMSSSSQIQHGLKQMNRIMVCATATVHMYIDINYLMISFRYDARRFLVFYHEGKMKHIGHIEFSCFWIDHLKFEVLNVGKGQMILNLPLLILWSECNCLVCSRFGN